MEPAEPGYCLIYITAGSAEEAERLAQVVLEKRLAACANIYAPIRSIYWWEGRLEKAEEAVLILKAPRKHYKAIEREILAHHSYQTPAILELPLAQGLPAFFQWLAQETQPTS
jgi:periplasmic divalent cation tolerance protein